jgi:hypothetical protein
MREKIYSCYLTKLMILAIKWKENFNIFIRNKIIDARSNGFKILKKHKWSLKIMKFVSISWYHPWSKAVEKIKGISHTLSCTMFTNFFYLRRSFIELRRWRLVCSQSDVQFGIWIQNFLYFSHTTNGLLS